MATQEVVLQDFTANSQVTDELLGTSLDVSITGTFVATIDVERFCAARNAWIVWKSWTAVTQEVITGVKPRRWRFKTSAYTSGTAVLTAEAGQGSGA